MDQLWQSVFEIPVKELPGREVYQGCVQEAKVIGDRYQQRLVGHIADDAKSVSGRPAQAGRGRERDSA